PDGPAHLHGRDTGGLPSVRCIQNGPLAHAGHHVTGDAGGCESSAGRAGQARRVSTPPFAR
ncbi:YtxH domain-containing protein, partial [Dysosmobacter welbionis]